MPNVIEYVKFKLKKGATAEQFLTASDKFQKEYLEKCKGSMQNILL